MAFTTLVNPLILMGAAEAGYNVKIKNHRFHSLRFKNGAQSLLTEDDPDYASDFEDEIESFDRIKEIDKDVYMKNQNGVQVM